MWRIIAITALLAVAIVGMHFIQFASLAFFDKEQSGSVGVDQLTIQPSPLEPVRLVFTGTSLTQKGNWPDEVREHLQACRTGEVSVEKITEAGANSDWALGPVRDRLGDKKSPIDLLVIEFSINDSSLIHGVPLEKSGANLDAMLSAARDAEVPVLLTTMNPAWGQKSLERLGQVAYRALLRDRIYPGWVGLMDTVETWQTIPAAERERLVPDGLHPTAEGMTKIMVPAFEQALKPILCEQ
ncbi:MAG: SGNH/GDSL hydrolase family protein [Alphaproteobacteria bacterium]|jgi:lysophospholipase L1-like esterase